MLSIHFPACYVSATPSARYSQTDADGVIYPCDHINTVVASKVIYRRRETV